MDVMRSAILRIRSGDVSDTRYGIRVAVRPDLGDNRADAEAYWPKEDDRTDSGWSCRCRQFLSSGGIKSDGYCSHILAARIVRGEVEVDPWASGPPGPSTDTGEAVEQL